MIWSFYPKFRAWRHLFPYGGLWCFLTDNERQFTCIIKCKIVSTFLALGLTWGGELDSQMTLESRVKNTFLPHGWGVEFEQLNLDKLECPGGGGGTGGGGRG